MVKFRFYAVGIFFEKYHFNILTLFLVFHSFNFSLHFGGFLFRMIINYNLLLTYI